MASTSGDFPKESQAVSGGYYYNNLVSIAEWLMSNGYSRAAAAGIAGTIAGESTGNPESVGSGGNGLIGWTPPKSGIVTGQPQSDFDNQLKDVLDYANANSAEAIARGGVNVQTLQKATDPNKAAEWWTAFEGPLVPGSDIRNGVVSNVYNSLQGFKPNSGYTQPGGGGSSSPSSSGSSSGSNLLSFPSEITGFFSDANDFTNKLMWLVQPGSWMRIGAGLVGVALLLFALYALIQAGSGEPLIKTPSVVPIPV